MFWRWIAGRSCWENTCWFCVPNSGQSQAGTAPSCKVCQRNMEYMLSKQCLSGDCLLRWMGPSIPLYCSVRITEHFYIFPEHCCIKFVTPKCQCLAIFLFFLIVFLQDWVKFILSHHLAGQHVCCLLSSRHFSENNFMLLVLLNYITK